MRAVAAHGRVEPESGKGLDLHVGGCQNYGPFLGPYYNTALDI